MFCTSSLRNSRQANPQPTIRPQPLRFALARRLGASAIKTIQPDQVLHYLDISTQYLFSRRIHEHAELLQKHTGLTSNLISGASSSGRNSSQPGSPRLPPTQNSMRRRRTRQTKKNRIQRGKIHRQYTQEVEYVEDRNAHDQTRRQPQEGTCMRSLTTCVYVPSAPQLFANTLHSKGKHRLLLPTDSKYVRRITTCMRGVTMTNRTPRKARRTNHTSQSYIVQPKIYQAERNTEFTNSFSHARGPTKVQNKQFA